MSRSEGIAHWFVRKWRQRLEDSAGAYFAVATQMRKQGIPLDIALAVLMGRASDR